MPISSVWQDFLSRNFLWLIAGKYFWSNFKYLIRLHRTWLYVSIKLARIKCYIKLIKFLGFTALRVTEPTNHLLVSITLYHRQEIKDHSTSLVAQCGQHVTPSTVSGFLELDYYHKSVASQISQDADSLPGIEAGTAVWEAMIMLLRLSGSYWTSYTIIF